MSALKKRYGDSEIGTLSRGLVAKWKASVAIEEEEREKYGRYWIWEGYFNEKRKDQWLETAEMLKHINPHVL